MLRLTLLRRGTLVKIGRGANNVTESASNALLESLQSHGYCYIQHPYIQKSILDQLHRDSRIFFEQYILSLQDAQASGNLRRNNKHNYNCTPLSEFELESIRSPSGFRGYYRYVGASGLDDAIDCFSIGRDDVADPATLRRAYYEQRGWEENEYLERISRRNPWDVLLNHVNDSKETAATGLNNNFMGDFRDMMVAYYELCSAVSMDVLRHIAFGLGITSGSETRGEYDLEYYTGFHSKRDCDLQVKYYPQLGQATRVSHGVNIQNKQSASNLNGVRVLRQKGAKTQPLIRDEEKGDGPGEPVVRLDTHTDLSTITLLSQDSLGGLEVWDDLKNEFIPVPVLEDALLVNPGVFLEKWTGGLIDATRHRVKNVKGGHSRCSIVFFAMPDHDAKIEPLLLEGETQSAEVEEDLLTGDLMPAP